MRYKGTVVYAKFKKSVKAEKSKIEHIWASFMKRKAKSEQRNRVPKWAKRIA